MKAIYFFVLVALPCLFMACGQNDGFSQKFNAGLSRGDLLQVGIDTKALTYSYEVVEGDLKNAPEGKASGKLIKKAGLGKGAFETDNGAFVIAIENKVIIGAMGPDFYVGIPQMNTDIKMATIAGDYNFVSYLPHGAMGNWRLTTLQGTLQISPTGKGKVVFNEKISAANAQNSLSINVVRKNSNHFVIESDDGTHRELANFLPRIDGKDIFAVLDFADANIAKGIGFAQQQKIITTNSLNGSYVAYDTGSPEFTKGIVSGTKLTLNNSRLNNAHASLKLNDPWPGIVHGTLPGVFDFFGIYSGAELYSILLESGSLAQAFIAIKE